MMTTETEFDHAMGFIEGAVNTLTLNGKLEIEAREVLMEKLEAIWKYVRELEEDAGHGEA